MGTYRNQIVRKNISLKTDALIEALTKKGLARTDIEEILTQSRRRPRTDMDSWATTAPAPAALLEQLKQLSASRGGIYGFLDSLHKAQILTSITRQGQLSELTKLLIAAIYHGQLVVPPPTTRKIVIN